ncbi:MAG: hypothetical protein HY912_03290 [Desulfomonile tiedjei]|uniref:Uncharacterized protein n=1 Tax=Desulfomonile tiedjei TaxID=2358 RepID=A0A9D6UY82_9BACT|nr:hypothetical protein [Desulfomonile tiedjei]
MEKCFWGDCLALKDLADQFSGPAPSHEAATYRAWAATIFGSNQLGLSLTLLTLKHFGIDFMTGYRITCVFAVLLFGLGFACLLTVLWGKPAAGFALLLLAFKVFPDTGLNFVVPSNLCMGLATLMWARVISTNGRALWTLGIGSVILIAFHPIGAAYSVMAAAFAVVYSGIKFSRRTWASAAIVVLALAVALLMPTRIYDISQYFPSPGLTEILRHAAFSMVTVLVEIVRLDAGLYGLLPLFLGCVALGTVFASPVQRHRVSVFLAIYSVFLPLSLFYPPRQPGDTFLRLWIPAVVVLFGAVSMAWWTTSAHAWQFLKSFRVGASNGPRPRIQDSWPLVAAAVIAGYAIQLSLAGAEQVDVISQHYKNRQPLQVCAGQTETLLAAARSGDRVLYESMMLMQCYFIKGALNLGAVYYHPVLKETVTETEWLPRRDLRFAVAYNPLVIHPTFEGLHERRWGLSSPDFRFSPLIGAKRHGPILHEDGIAVNRFKCLDVDWGRGHSPRSMTVLVDNPGSESSMQVFPLDGSGLPSDHRTITLKIPQRAGQHLSWEFEGIPNLEERTGKKRHNIAALNIDLTSMHPATRLRLRFPPGNSPARIIGIRFDDSQLNWPWEHRAQLIVTDKSWDIGAMVFSFDPVKILPESLQRSDVRVINDCGSSVLLEIVASESELR